VLLWGSGADGPLVAVREELDLLGVPYLVVDQRDVLNTEIQLTVNGGLEGTIRMRARCVDLAAVTAVYLRPYEPLQSPVVTRAGSDVAARRHALAVGYTMMSWSRITRALVVNRPQAAAANGSKPYQLGQIRSFGFEVPDTLLTTDPDAARDFWQRHGTVVYKSVSGTRSIVSRLKPEHAERLANVKSCPTLFQQYVPGKDHRIHVVGDEVFACEIISEADDYRYPAHHKVEIRACRLPQDIVDRCRRLGAAVRLPVAGIDLRRTPEEDWYCFEVNPSPAFTYYTDRTGQPIGLAIARLLAAGQQDAPRLPEADAESTDLKAQAAGLRGPQS